VLLCVQVSCTEPYEWKDPTVDEWEFSQDAQAAAGGKRFKVRGAVVHCHPYALQGQDLCRHSSFVALNRLPMVRMGLVPGDALIAVCVDCRMWTHGHGAAVLARMSLCLLRTLML
jgi:hypothetical protein